MKKKSLLFAVCLLSMVLFFSCGGDGGNTTTEQPSPNILRITGIPEDVFMTFAGNEAYVGIFTSGTNSIAAQVAFAGAMVATGNFSAPLVAGSSGDDIIGTPVPVAGFATVDFPLHINWQSGPWTGSGSFHIGIIVDPSGTPSLFYTPAIAFTTGTTTVPFDPEWAN